MSAAVSNRINDLTSVLQTTEDHSVTQLQDIAMELDTWKTKVGAGISSSQAVIREGAPWCLIVRGCI